MEDLYSPAARRISRRFPRWVAACAAAAIGLMVTSISASADQNEPEKGRNGKRAPTVLATQPFFLAINETASCAYVNVGTVPLQVTLTSHFEGTDHVGAFVATPGPNVGKLPLNISQPGLVYFKFESTDISMLKADCFVGRNGYFGSILQAIPAE